MSLRPCPDCGKKVSEHADICPECGCPQPAFCTECGEDVDDNDLQCPHCGKVFTEQVKQSLLLYGFFAIVVALMILGAYAKFRTQRTERGLKAVQKAQDRLNQTLDKLKN